MFRPLSKHFPDRSSGNSTDSSGAGRKAQRKLNQALIFGALLLGLFVASPFLLSDPEPPAGTDQPVSEQTTAPSTAVDRTPAPADPSPIDFKSPGVIVAVLLLAGGVGIALYLRNGGSTQATRNNVIFPVAEYKISPQQKLQLVHCTDELLLLAVTPEQIDLLKTYPADAVPVNGASPAAPDGSDNPPHVGFNGTPFSEVLRNYASQYTLRQ